MDKAAPDPLQAFRHRIDALDEKIHHLLVERAHAAAALSAAQGAIGPAVPLRPDREADMLRRLALRHEGPLPLASVEHVWREMMGTAARLQAPFRVVVGPAADAVAMRELTRFHFGFAVPVEDAESNEAAIARTRDREHVAVIAIDAEEAWWNALAGAAAPKVVAKLPFMELPGRLHRATAYVVAVLDDGHANDIRLYGLDDAPRLGAAVARLGGAIVACRHRRSLVELPSAVTLDELRAASGAALADSADLGGFAQPIRFTAKRVA